MNLFKKHKLAAPIDPEIQDIKLLLSTAEIGHWSWTENGSINWDSAAAKLIGYEADNNEHAVTDFLLHVKDNEHEVLLDAFETCITNDHLFNQIVTLSANHANTLKLRMVGKLTKGPATLEKTIEGICLEYKEAPTTTLPNETSSFEDFFDRSKVMMAELDLDGTFIRANAEWGAFIGIESEHLIGRPFLDFLHPDNLPNTKLWLKQLGQRPAIASVRPTAHGELSAQIHVTGKGAREISWTWTADLQQKRIFTVTRDITDIYNEETELTQEFARAQRSNSELENFASTASHDLREPLRMISSYLKLLQERYPEALDNRGRRYIDYASQGAERMRTLIEDLLAYSRIGKTSKPHEAVALDDVISHAIDNLSVSIRQTNADIIVDINNAPIVLGDPIRLTRLFQNLLSNAIKFQDGATVPRVTIRFENGIMHNKTNKHIVSIQDNGIGINPDHKDILFHLFQRLNTRDEFEGSGIGLSVCKKIIEQHQGEIWFDSVPKEGSTFYVSLKKTKNENF